MSCETPIRWYDNVPVLSYALLRGRCRKCGTRIPPRDLAIELTTALLLVGCVLAFGLTLRQRRPAIACAAFVVVTATDIERRIVPNRVVLPAAPPCSRWTPSWHPSPVWAIGAFGLAGFLFLVALAYPGGMGMGDVKLALLIGALLGRTTPVGFMLGLLPRPRPEGLPDRAPRPRRPEARDPVRAVPRRRRRDRPLRRQAILHAYLGPPDMRRLRCLPSLR